ncbi:hypothetical protein [Stakelama saccharophila]|uniref:Uncharacterized protein n=1 Tax=Stakelama saccharophila TaxID=3075605 RepID=A0ABZ0BBY7_9SPHN|nr:hypothetical protein [Stakelama sp. W311]WNO54899.1 hypothetical protein RPR59_06545 [Stakelama sp. W311]
MTDDHPTLARQLGFERGMKVWFRDMPAPIRSAIDPPGNDLEELVAPSQGIEGAAIFVDARDALSKEVHALHELLTPAGFVWVAWRSGLDESVVRETGRSFDMLPTDTAAIGDWTAMKLVGKGAH